MHYNFIAIEGNIGAGKTTLASKLALSYKGKLILEEFDTNPFLPRFYKNPAQYALALELSFLAERFQQLKTELRNGDYLRIADYYFSKTLVFARTNLPPDEFSVFEKMFSITAAQLPVPELVIFLNPRTEKLKENIHKRGRTYEGDRAKLS